MDTLVRRRCRVRFFVLTVVTVGGAVVHQIDQHLSLRFFVVLHAHPPVDCSFRFLLHNHLCVSQGSDDVIIEIDDA